MNRYQGEVIVKALGNELQLDITEVDFAYRQVDKITQIMEIMGENVAFKNILDFVYYIYPSFFLAGLKIKEKWIIIDATGKVQVADTNKNHHPRQYCFEQLSRFMQCCRESFGWQLSYQQSSEIIKECQKDFSEEYLSKFPYVTRVFTTSTSKFEQYKRVGKPVEFAYFEFKEIQANTADIVADKLSQIEVEEEKIVIADDEGLEINCLNRAPGPYIKPILDCIGIEGINDIVLKYGDDKMWIDISCGMKYKESGCMRCLILSAKFPVSWRSVSQGDKDGYYGYMVYRDKSLLDCDESYDPRGVLLFWLWHRYRRRRLKIF